MILAVADLTTSQKEFISYLYSDYSYNRNQTNQFIIEKKYMILHNYNIMCRYLNCGPKDEFFIEISKYKYKIYFEINDEPNRLTAVHLIYDETVDRMGIQIKNTIIRLLHKHGFSGKMNQAGCNIFKKSFFIL